MNFPYLHLSAKGLLSIIPFINTLQNSLGFQTQFLSPLSSILCFSKICKIMIAPFVVCLFYFCCPLAITWIIVFIIIYTIKCISLIFSKPNISKKILEFIPSLAYFYPSSTIKFVLNGVGISASVMHSLPTLVGKSITHTMFIPIPSDFFLIHANNISEDYGISKYMTVHHLGS